MNNLRFEDLKALSVSIADNTLLEKIAGGTADDCHDLIPILDVGVPVDFPLDPNPPYIWHSGG